MAETSYIIQNGRRLNLKDSTARKSIGSCSELQTETKHCLVSAINELNEKVLNGGGGGGGAAGVESFNGRTGAVVPAAGDYTAEQVGAAASDLSNVSNDVMKAKVEASGFISGGGGDVYIGPDEPEDADVWFDTSEAGDSEGFYTKGETDDLLAGKVSMTLLWENASPSSAFAAQTISLDLSGYEFIYVIAANWFVSGFVRTQVGASGTINRYAPISWSKTTGSRNLDIVETGIYFTGGYSGGAIGGTFSAANGECVPTQIYGIKGVSA